MPPSLFSFSLTFLPLRHHGLMTIQVLQLLEYLVKHGSEHIVDNACSHISAIKMLCNFHYIDNKEKDQGINSVPPTHTLIHPSIPNSSLTHPTPTVRNHSCELAKLLSDVEKICIERHKANANKSKYIGMDSNGLSFTSGSLYYSGFDSDLLGGSGSGSYDGSVSRFKRGECIRT